MGPLLPDRADRPARRVGILAKTVSTLDVLSGGRAVLGVGAAWFEREHRGLGVPFPPLSERLERLEEALQICNQMSDPYNNARTRASTTNGGDVVFTSVRQFA